MGGDWRPDPTARHQERFYDEGAWTSRVRDRGIENLDHPGRLLTGRVGDSAEPSGASVRGAVADRPVFGKIRSDSLAAGGPASDDAWSGPAHDHSAGSHGSSPIAPRLSSAERGPIASVTPAPVAGAADAIGSAARLRRASGIRGIMAFGLTKLIVGLVVISIAATVTVFVVVRNEKPTRSAANFCKTMASEQKRILAQMKQTSEVGEGDEFAKAMMGMVASVQALGELQVYFAKLAKVAPAEIETETQLVADKIGEQMKVPDFSITGIGNSIINSIVLSGPLESVNSFALRHCGKSV